MHQKLKLIHDVFTSRSIFKVASFSIKTVREHQQKIFKIFDSIWPLRGEEGKNLVDNLS